MTASRTARPWLLPLTPVYRLGLALRELRLRAGWEKTRRLRFPVISIGNLSTGGAGKTPMAIALAKALTARGFAVDVLSRGYGRSSSAPSRVRFDGTAEEFGDEPLVIAHDATVPVYVARHRYQAGELAEAYADQKVDDHRPHVHILDDGFQHRQLHRDVDILLLNREDWRDRLLPAGNLREGVGAAARSDVIAIAERDRELEGEVRRWGWEGPIWRLHRKMDVPRIAGPVVAFCGIARPDQFFEGLQEAGLQVAARIAFRDHHRYTTDDLNRLCAAVSSAGAAALVTTGKDMVRLGQLSVSLPSELPLLSAGLRIEMGDETAALDWLIGRLGDIQPQLSL